MKRFAVALDDDTFEDFVRTFPDFGSRSALIRRCIHSLIRCAKEDRQAYRCTEEIANEVYKRR